MTDDRRPPEQTRALLLAPTPRDGQASRALLASAGIECALCRDLPDLCRQFAAGAAVLIVPEECVLTDEADLLVRDLGAQPVWSDLPVIVLTRGGGVESPAAAKAIATLGNVSLVERPVRVSTLISVVRTAQRARERQYQARDHLAAVERGERALAEKSRQLQLITDSAPVYIAQLDRERRFLFVNRGYARRFHVDPDAIVGRTLPDVLGPAAFAAIHPYVDRVLAGEPVQFEIEIPYRDVGRRHMSCAYVPEFDAAGAVRSFVAVITDATERKRGEQALREARAAAEAANAAKDRFLAVLSHELRTPLSPVVMTVAALEADPAIPEHVRADLAVVRRNVDLETTLIDDLLDLSRVISGKLRLNVQRADLHEVLRHAVASSTSELSRKRLDVRFDLRATRARVTGDPARLQQVFWNLLKNAAKFTPDGGHVTVRTFDVPAAPPAARDRNGDRDGAAAAAAAANPRIRVEIQDTGVGIPADVLPRIFDAFEQGEARVTQRFGGLGLGLAICKAVVDMHGGTITAASDGKDAGATFTVELDTIAPAADAAGPAPHPAGANRDHRARALRPRILLVEDHPDTARTLARLLARAGYPVKTAGTVAAALRLAAAEAFDLVVSDIGLPDATGYDLMTQLRARHRLKGIALSGYGMEDDMRKSREAGFVDHVVKPVNVAQLETVIQRVAAGE